MKSTDQNYCYSLNKAINMKSGIKFYSCVKMLSEIRHISLERAYWILVYEF